jgi:flagellar motor switch protein FliG
MGKSDSKYEAYTVCEKKKEKTYDEMLEIVRKENAQKIRDKIFKRK